jgi:hypothetical protein
VIKSYLKSVSPLSYILISGFILFYIGLFLLFPPPPSSGIVISKGHTPEKKWETYEHVSKVSTGGVKKHHVNEHWILNVQGRVLFRESTWEFCVPKTEFDSTPLGAHYEAKSDHSCFYN